MNLATSAPASVSNMPHGREPGVEGHGSSRDENPPSTRLYLSFTRATRLVSAFTCNHSRVTNHRSKGRNSQSAFAPRNSLKTNAGVLQRAERPGASESPIFRRALHILAATLHFTNHRPPLIHRGLLPGTVNRVETPISRRKQTTGHTSTRNVPSHRNFRQNLASVTRTACTSSGSERSARPWFSRS